MDATATDLEFSDVGLLCANSNGSNLCGNATDANTAARGPTVHSRPNSAHFMPLPGCGQGGCPPRKQQKKKAQLSQQLENIFRQRCEKQERDAGSQPSPTVTFVCFLCPARMDRLRCAHAAPRRPDLRQRILPA